MQGERLVLEPAFERQLGLRLSARLAGRRRDRTVELELALGIAIGDAAVGDLELTDQRRLVALLGRDGLGCFRRHWALAQAPVQLSPGT